MGPLDLDLPALTALLEAWGEPAYRARQVHAQLWRRGAAFEEMTDLPPALRHRLAAELPIGMEVVTERRTDGGATRKALLRFGGRHVVEPVLMGYRVRVRVC